MVSGYLTGTRILTTAGDVPVETLVDGELAVTTDGRMLQVVWLAKARIDPRRHAAPDDVSPVCIKRGALADGVPARDLVVGPAHLVVVNGLDIPARRLVNGATIVRLDAAEPIAYFEIELTGDAVILAEGTPVRSYCDTGNSGLFANSASSMKDRRSAATSVHGVRPALDDQALESVRASILARALDTGYALTRNPGLRVVAGRRTIPAGEAIGSRYQFEIPAGTTQIELQSSTFVPDEIEVNTRDNRRLGVALVSAWLEGDSFRKELDLHDPAHDGFYPPETDGDRGWRWTNGTARLAWQDAGPVRMLVIETAHQGVFYWENRRDASSAAAAQGGSGLIVFISGEQDTPGHLYRVVRAAEAATRLGLTAHCLDIEAVAANLDLIAAADTVIIWRAPLEHRLRAALDAARRGHATVLLDLDDLMVDPRLARPDIIDAIRFNGFDDSGVKRLYTGINEAAHAVDACLCTTAELATHLRIQQRPTYVLPNGYDARSLRLSRHAMRARQMAEPDGLIRFGYAGGTRTHQEDFRPVATALSRLLRENPQCRLVLFRRASDQLPLLDPREFPALAVCQDQIEWRDMVAVADLPLELARFDVNLAPLDTDNLFCEAKSEIKYLEAALAGVCTVASPTGPFQRAIRDGETGFFATTARTWYAVLRRLAEDPVLRQTVAKAAYHDVLWKFGPDRRADLLASILAQTRPGRAAARAFELELRRAADAPAKLPSVPAHKVVHHADRLGDADVTVIVPLYNYEQYIKEALDSVWHQTEQLVDLVVIDDCSSDGSLAVVMDWVQRNGARFNRLLVLQNDRNSGLGLTRNVGFAAAETPYVLPLDADNRLYPRCLSACLGQARATGAAFVYPAILQFGDGTDTMNDDPFSAARLISGNFIDAMALVAKWAWAAAGGYHHGRLGWEDYDFWCRLVKKGLWGERIDDVLAGYRVHKASMLRTITEITGNKKRLLTDIQRRHPWLAVEAVELTEARIKRMPRYRPMRRQQAAE